MTANQYTNIAASQSDGIAAVIDINHEFDAKQAEESGVDLKLLLVAQPIHSEEAGDIASMLVQSGAVRSVFVLE